MLTESDRELVAGLKVIKTVQKLMGIDLEDLNAPAERPPDTKIEILNTPGVRFLARVSPAGFSAVTGFLALFTTFWCGFMVVWNLIGIFTGAWVMVGFGVLHDLVGLFLLYRVLWSLVGREQIRAEDGQFVRVKRIFCLKTTKTFAWEHVDDFTFGAKSTSNRRSSVALKMISGSKRVRLAANAQTADQRWLRTELRKFFAPIWGD